MQRVMRFMKKNRRGANMAEYSLLLALIAVFLIIVVQVMRGAVADKFTTASTKITAAN